MLLISIHIKNNEEKDQLEYEINFYKKLLTKCTCPFEKLYYSQLIIRKMEFLVENNKLNLQECLCNNTRKIFTLEELNQYNGSNNKPAYVAVNGTVYDVSLEAAWGGASHFGLVAGKDLTSEFKSCHSNLSILDKLPVVGTLA